ncbi:ATP-binding cassette domain-containing protein [Acidovorax radicis]|jgi:ABC-type transport system involved in cytochrome c biogenesis ATPase subunit|uniref:ABC transporter ATP-binding protein n=1 Tax=Acidovorax radicis TaxID=758826 RepID=UPI001CF8ED4A|nr:ATP-binding cassette domain-containing protein [Acidovorax radicis]UCU98153.1 ATP-binding cassette domain-containing protein [Acidovorax radicis]
MSENVVLRVEGLCFAYPECGVLEQWSAALPAGLTLVRGDESSGKTTLLRLLAGQLQPQAGQIRLQGLSPGDAPKAYAQKVFWADPRSGDLDALTARGWLGSLPARYPLWDAAALAAHTEGFTLHEHLDKPFYALSTGSKRKVLMAGALASGAPLTLIDEPVGGLDKPSAAYLGRALAQVAGQPGRVVVVAHYESLPGVPWGTVVELNG